MKLREMLNKLGFNDFGDAHPELEMEMQVAMAGEKGKDVVFVEVIRAPAPYIYVEIE